MNGGGDTAETRRAPLWMRALLIASLAVNLAVAGVVAGAAFRAAERGQMRAVPPVEGFRGVARALPEAHGAAVRAEMQKLRGEFQEIRTEVRTAQRDFLAALRAEPFDPGAAADALGRQAGGWERIAARTRNVLLSELARMDPEARAEFAATLEASLNRMAAPDRR